MSESKGQGKVVIYYLAAILVSLAVTVGFQHYTIRARLAEQGRAKMVAMAESLSSAVDETITNKLHQFELIALQLASRWPLPEDAISDQLAEMQKLQCQYTQSIFVADPSGKAVDSFGREHNIAERPYFQNAMHGRKGISDIQISEGGETSVVTLTVPLVQDSQFVGVFGGNVSVDVFTPAIQTIIDDSSTTPYLTGRDATIFRLPDVELVSLNLPISEITTEPAGFGRFAFDDTDHLMSWTVGGKSGWKVFVTTPVADFYSVSNSILRSVVMVFLVLSGVVVILGMLLVKRNQLIAQREYRYNHDQLTGLYSRAYCEEYMARLDQSHEVPVSLIMGDLNTLKIVNDTFGHSAGDELLQKTAEILVQSCRKEDIVARWGGDEFIIVSPLTDEAAAQNIITRIKKNCRQNGWIDLLRPSIALGAATKIRPDEDLKAVFKEAEERMYQQKAVERSGTRPDLASIKPLLAIRSVQDQSNIAELKKLTLEFGKALGLSDQDLTQLALLILLYDIGQIGVPRDILQKKGELTRAEREVIHKHPEIGYHLSNLSPVNQVIARAILAHHERWDGTGYPYQLKGEQIPLLARILGITVAFDAMCSERPYRRSKTKDEAIRELIQNAGTQFDPHLVQIFLSLFPLEASS